MKDLLKGLAGYGIMCILACGVLLVIALAQVAASYAPVAAGLLCIGGLIWFFSRK